MAKMTGTTWKLWSLTVSKGRKETVTGNTPFCLWPGVQQSMGHLESLSPTDMPEVDAGGSASLW